MLLALVLLAPPPLSFSWNGRPVPCVHGELVGIERDARWTVGVEPRAGWVRLTIYRDGLVWDEPDLTWGSSIECVGVEGVLRVFAPALPQGE